MRRVAAFAMGVRRRLVARGAYLSRTRFSRLTAGKQKLLVWLSILGVAGATVGGLLQLRVETTVQSFLPQSDPSVAAMEQNARAFGGDPVVVLMRSRQPQQLMTDQQRFGKLMKLEGQLAKLPNVATVYGPATVMNQLAIASQDMLARISGTRDGLRARAEAQARQQGLSGAAVQAKGDAATAAIDKRYGSLIVRGLPGGLPTATNPNFIKHVIYDNSGNPRARWHFVVPNANSVAVLVRPREDIDQGDTKRLVSSIRDAVNHAGLNPERTTVTGVPAVTASLTTEAMNEIPLLGGLAVLVLLLRFLIAPATKSGWLRRLWPLSAALLGAALTLAVFGWAGMSLSVGAIVLFPLLLGIGSSFPLYLATGVNRRRVLVVSVASAIAFGSLAVSPLSFVRELGIALGLGVLLTVGVTLSLERAFGFTHRQQEDEPEPERSDPGTAVSRGGRWVTLGCLLAVAAVGWALLPHLDVRANPEDVARGLPELSQAKYAEQVLGSSGEVSIVLRGADVQTPQALAWMDRAQDVALSRHGDQLRPVLTAPDLLSFLGTSPNAGQISAGLQLLPQYLTNAVFTPDGQQGVLTFGVKFQDLSRQSALLDDVRKAMPPPPPGLHVDTVGLPVAASRSYELISQDRYLANAAGIVAAGAVLLLGLRRRRDAWYAMLAAVMATGWMVFGLWLLGIPLNPLTMALGSLATVTACEFTVLLTRERSARRTRLNRLVGWACLTSMVGYLAVVPSQIGLLREFGLTLAVTVLASYLAALSVVRLRPSVTRRPAVRSRTSEDQSPGQERVEVLS
jgi:hypothetical protein